MSQPKNKFNPHQDQDLLPEVLLQDPEYTADRKQAYQKFVRENLAQKNTGLTFSLTHFYDNFLRLITKNSLVALGLFLVTLGGVSGLAAELLAPTELKPSHILQAQTNKTEPIPQATVPVNLEPPEKTCSAHGLSFQIPTGWDCNSSTQTLRISSDLNNLEISFVENDTENLGLSVQTEESMYYESEILEFRIVAVQESAEAKTNYLAKGVCSPTTCNLTDHEVLFILTPANNDANNLEIEKNDWAKTLNSFRVNPAEFPEEVTNPKSISNEQIYTNEVYGFEFTYPDNLELTENKIDSGISLTLRNGSEDEEISFISTPNSSTPISQQIGPGLEILVGSKIELNGFTIAKQLYSYQSESEDTPQVLAYAFQKAGQRYIFFSDIDDSCQVSFPDCKNPTIENILQSFNFAETEVYELDGLQMDLPQAWIVDELETGEINFLINDSQIAASLTNVKELPTDDNSAEIFTNPHGIEITKIEILDTPEEPEPTLSYYFTHKNKTYKLETTVKKFSSVYSHEYSPELLADAINTLQLTNPN